MCIPSARGGVGPWIDLVVVDDVDDVVLDHLTHNVRVCAFMCVLVAAMFGTRAVTIRWLACMPSITLMHHPQPTSGHQLHHQQRLSRSLLQLLLPLPHHGLINHFLVSFP